MWGSYYDRDHDRDSKSPSPDFEANPMAGWKKLDAQAAADLHPSQMGKGWLKDGPYEAAVKKHSWLVPKVPHPLSLLLLQLVQPKVGSSERWIEDLGTCKHDYYRFISRPKLEHVPVFSAEDGAPLGTLRALQLDGLRRLARASPFGMGAETVYDDAVRRGKEIRAAQLLLGLASPLGTTAGCPGYGQNYTGAWYFSDIAYQVGSFLFPGASSVKLVLYKLAMYTKGGHFRMHKDTTHADSHVGTVLIGCGVAQDDEPGSEGAEPLNDYDYTQKVKKDGYTGGDLVVLNDDGKEQRYHIRPGQVLAFCTDVPHAVDVVTSGVKLTLQFDVYLEDESVSRENTVACVDIAKREAFYASDYWWQSEPEEGGENDAPDSPEVALPPPICSSCNRHDCVASDEKVHAAVDMLRNWEEWGYADGMYTREHVNGYVDRWEMHWRFEEETFGRYPVDTFAAALESFIAHLIALLQHGAEQPPPDSPDPAFTAPRTVAFLLNHMYRRRSIRPEFLKTVDASLYRALAATEKLRVVLHHVTYQVEWRSELGVQDQRLALCPPYAEGCAPGDIAEPVLVLHGARAEDMRLKTMMSEMIARGEIYVGNEALDEPSWYVAGAMFVSLL